jgi:hypothetical protein
MKKAGDVMDKKNMDRQGTSLSKTLQMSLVKDLYPSRFAAKKTGLAMRSIHAQRKNDFDKDFSHASLALDGRSSHIASSSYLRLRSKKAAGTKSHPESTFPAPDQVEHVDLQQCKADKPVESCKARQSRSIVANASGEISIQSQKALSATDNSSVATADTSLATSSILSDSSERSAPKRASSMKKDGSRRERIAQRSISVDQLTQVKCPPPGQMEVTVLKRTRSIQFNEAVKVKRIPSAVVLNDGKAEELWFQQEEYERIKQKTKALIRAVQQEKAVGTKYCTRGLERFFAVEEVIHTRESARASVLGEQAIQRRLGSYDDVKLGQAYEKHTQPCIAQAAQRGKLDEDAIGRYVHQMKQICRTYSMPETFTKRMSIPRVSHTHTT